MAKTEFLSEETDCPAGMPCEKVCREIKEQLADLDEFLRGPKKGNGGGILGRVRSLEQITRAAIVVVLAALAPLWAKLMGLIGK